MQQKIMSKVKTNSKELKIIGISFIIVLVTVLGFFVGTNNPILTANGKQNIDFTKGNTLVTQGAIEDIVADMLVEKSVVTMSEKDLEMLTAQLTTGVLNSVPENVLTDENIEIIRKMISEAVKEAALEQRRVTTNMIKDNNEWLEDKMQVYLSSEVIPSITALIQINAGEIADLRASLAALSSQYNEEKNEKDKIINEIYESIKNINIDGEKVENNVQNIVENVTELKEVLNSYKSETATYFTTYEAELTAVKELLEIYYAETIAYTDEKIAAIKGSLNEVVSNIENKITQIEGDSSETVIELQEIINNLEISNEQDLLTLEMQLTEAIDASNLANSEALEAAVTVLNVKISELQTALKSITDKQLEELKESLLSQINTNPNLSEAQKNELNQALAALDSETASNLEEIKEYLKNYSDNLNQSTVSSLSNAIANLAADTTKTAEEVRSDLLFQIEQNAELSDSERLALAGMIKELEISTNADMESIQSQLNEAVSSQASKLENAVNDLNEVIVDILRRIEELEARMIKLTAAQIADLKASLEAQIEANADLSEEQRKELLDTINGINENNANSIEEIKEYLKNYTDSLNKDTIDSLKDTIAALEADTNKTADEVRNELLEQIAQNAKLSDSQKEMLEKMIAELELSTGEDIADVQKQLAGKLDEQTAIMENAVNSLNATIDNLAVRISILEEKVNNLTETQLEELKTSLQAQIDANTQLTETQKKELLEIINGITIDTASDIESVKNYLKEYTDTVNQDTIKSLTNAIAELEANTSQGAEAVRKELLDQITANAELSEEQKKALEEMIVQLEISTGADMDDIRKQLSDAIVNQTAALEAAVGDLNATIDDILIHISNLQAQYTDITEVQLVELKNSLIDQINANKALSDTQREELLAIIDSMSVDTAADIESVKAYLKEYTDKLNADTEEAFNDAIAALEANTSQGADELKAELLAQIEANAELSEEQKKALEEMISQLEISTDADMEDIRQQLSDAVADQTAAMNAAVNDLQTSIDGLAGKISILESQTSSLSSTINANKTAQDQVNASQATTNQNLANKDTALEQIINNNKTEQDALNQTIQQQLSELAGNGYIVYTNGDFYAFSPDGKTSKKLGFAE